MNAYDKVKLARDKDRPTSIDYIEHLFNDFIEFHGDRKFADDKTIIGGVALLKDMPVTIIAIERGKDTKDRIMRNFGAVNPDGYRKALRLMKQAEKFHRPVICLIDTSGAACGIGAEERGQGQAIAENIMEMSALKTPIISIVIGEAESGGALALGVADQVWMLENSIYSLITPEGCASILWKDPEKTAYAADCLKMTSKDLLDFGIIDQIIKEDDNFNTVYNKIRDMLFDAFEDSLKKETDQLINERYEKYRKMGI